MAVAGQNTRPAPSAARKGGRFLLRQPLKLCYDRKQAGLLRDVNIQA